MAALQNQVVLVTGCSTGIGRALARELAARGHRTYATARKPETLADLESEGIRTLRLDVNDRASVQQAVSAAVEREGHVDVLINNAGVNVFGPIVELPLEQVRALFETNVLGVLAVTQAVFPYMADRRSGRIVNVGSVVGLLPTPFAAAYCATKSAIHMLSDVLRMEVQPFGIDVTVVQPGGVESNIAESGSRDLERFRSDESRYRLAYDGIRKRAFASQESPMPAADFAREFVEQAFESPAPRVIRLGTGADYLPRLAEMPGEQRDSMLSANYGLQDLAARLSTRSA